MENTNRNISAILNSSDEELIQAFYAHKLDVYCSNAFLKNCHSDHIEISNRVCRILRQFTILDIIKLVQIEHIPFPIAPKDIPQFSNLNDCFLRVPQLLLASGLEHVNFEQMGYLLRTEKRSSIADKKYGENHAKTAAMLGLCSHIHGKGFIISVLGYCYSFLSDKERLKLQAPLALYIPFIQNCIFSSDVETTIKNGISILSKSTQKRREPNIRALINLIQDKTYEF